MQISIQHTDKKSRRTRWPLKSLAAVNAKALMRVGENRNIYNRCADANAPTAANLSSLRRQLYIQQYTALNINREHRPCSI